MASSGLYTYTVSRDEIIKAALRILGAFGKGASLDVEDQTNGSQALNLILKNWSDKGLPIWAVQRVSKLMTVGVGSYTIGIGGSISLGYKPKRLLTAYLRNSSNIDTEIRIISRQEYDVLGNKTTPSVVNQIYYDDQLPLGTIYTYGVPSDSSTTLFISVQRPIQDVTAFNENFDLPQDWFLPLKWCLAEELALEYGTDEKKTLYVTEKARFLREEVFNWTEEEPSIFFTMDSQFYNG